jgi:hypothetical protein
MEIAIQGTDNLSKGGLKWGKGINEQLETGKMDSDSKNSNNGQSI